MGAVVVVTRRRKGSGALGGSALLDGAQTSNGRIQIGLGCGGLSIALGGASQGGVASDLHRAGLLLCGASGRAGLLLIGASGIGVAVERRCVGG